MFGFRVAHVQQAQPGPRRYAAISTARRRWVVKRVDVGERWPVDCWITRFGTRLRCWRAA